MYKHISTSNIRIKTESNCVNFLSFRSDRCSRRRNRMRNRTNRALFPFRDRSVAGGLLALAVYPTSFCLSICAICF